VEGQHFVMEYRLAAGKRERLPELAADLVQAKVDVIVAAGTAPTLPAVRATGVIPIVFVAFSPVEPGIVASLARPGANVTGVALHVGAAQASPASQGDRPENLTCRVLPYPRHLPDDRFGDVRDPRRRSWA
jgi:ABC-type uncharacterized transport system substrate-binding protein